MPHLVTSFPFWCVYFSCLNNRRLMVAAHLVFPASAPQNWLKCIIEAFHIDIDIIPISNGHPIRGALWLWSLKTMITKELHKLKQPDHLSKGYPQYLNTIASQDLASILYSLPIAIPVWESFIIPHTVITDTKHQVVKKKLLDEKALKTYLGIHTLPSSKYLNKSSTKHTTLVSSIRVSMVLEHWPPHKSWSSSWCSMVSPVSLK